MRRDAMRATRAVQPDSQSDPRVAAANRIALLILLLGITRNRHAVRGAGHGVAVGGGGGGGPAVPTVFDGGLLEAWDGTYSGDPTTIPTGNMLATFTPTQGGAFDVAGSQLVAWNGTVYIVGTPTFWILRSLDGTTRIHVAAGVGGITLDNSIDGLAWQVGRKLVLSGGLLSGGATTFAATCTKGTIRLGHESEQPRLIVDVTTIPVTSGATVICESGDDPLVKYASTGPNDLFLFRAGQTWTLTDEIVIDTAHAKVIDTTGTKPAMGAAIVGATEATANSYPKVVCASGKSAIRVANNVRLWRVMGLEVTCDPNEQAIVSGFDRFSSLIDIGTDTIPSISVYPFFGGVDRCYVHGYPNSWKKGGVSMRGGHVFIVDSDLSEIHHRTTTDSPSDGNLDSQAATYFHGPGPFRILHCRLQSSHEPFAIGNTPEAFNGICPSDGVIEQCILTADLAWHATNPDIAGHHTRKNGTELKKGHRMVYRNCVIENVWVDNQSGEAFMLWSGANTGGLYPWVFTCDVTIDRCLIRGAAGGVIIDTGSNVPAEFGVPTKRLWIKNTAFIWIGDDTITGNYTNGSGKNFGVQINNSGGDVTRAISEVTIEHCDFGHKDGGNSFPGTLEPSDEVHQNIIFRSNKGNAPGSPFSSEMFRSSAGTGDAGFAATMGAGCSWTNNLMFYPGATVDAAHNTYAAFTMAEGANIYDANHIYRDTSQTTRAAVLNLKLAVGSVGVGSAHDGTDPGVDADALYAGLAGVIA